MSIEALEHFRQLPFYQELEKDYCHICGKKLNGQEICPCCGAVSYDYIRRREAEDNQGGKAPKGDGGAIP